MKLWKPEEKQPRFLHLVQKDKSTLGIIDLAAVNHLWVTEDKKTCTLNLQYDPLPHTYNDSHTISVIIEALVKYRKQQGEI